MALYFGMGSQNLCFECNQPADVNHHVIPQSMGGTKTVPLCNKCHSMVHQAKLHSSGKLISEGKKRSKDLRLAREVLSLHEKGLGKTHIAKTVKISRRSVYHILRRAGAIVNEGKGCNFKIDSKMIDKIMELRAKGNSWGAVVQQCDISHTHLYRLLNKHKMKDGEYHGKGQPLRQTYKVVDDAMIERAKKLRVEEHLTWEQIAERLGIARETLYLHKIPQQFKPLRGQMTPDKAEMARQMRADGKSWREITSELGVSKNTIYRYGLHK